jgi:hypothetical protein
MSRDPSTRTEEDTNRVIPLTGSDAMRRLAVQEGKLFDGELEGPSDRKRLYWNNEYVRRVFHDGVASVADMLVLDSTSDRGCKDGDKCRLTSGEVYECVGEDGSTIDQWILFGLGAGSTGATHWEPISNGQPGAGELLFGANGDVLMTIVTD